MPTMKVIGRYEIKSEIARGGMATVYHAYDPRFERDVAIKVLPQAMMHDQLFRARFEREAKMIALLEHPAIVPVYDFGEENSQPYIVMRYMAGGSLTGRLNQGPLTLLETAQIVVRLAPALDAAHARGIIHRDLKPGNILFDQYGNAYLSDFGIARISASSSATLTGESILGTPAYMSPEQVQGDKTIDGQSDLYSLGVLIYHMLVGHPPYQADSPAKVMMMHILQPVPAIRQERSDLPAAIDPFINRAMAKKPSERFTTAGELAQNLESITRSVTGVGPLVAQIPTVASSPAQRPDFQMPTVNTPGETVVSPDKTAISSPTEVVPLPVPAKRSASSWSPAAPSVSQPAAPAVGLPAKGERRGPAIGLILAILMILALAVSGGILLLTGYSGRGPLAMLAPATATRTTVPTLPPTPTHKSPQASSDQPTALPSPTIPLPTATENQPIIAPTSIPPSPTSAPALPVIGGADKIAFLDKNEVWVANMDGSDLVQLTDDGVTKSNLQWTPDGHGVNYISGKCVYTVHLEDKQKEIVTCFNFAQYFKAFEISPDGTQVALSIDNQLYIEPYDLNKLRSVTVRDDLTKIAECKEFAPYLRFFTKFPRWSRDGSQMAKVIMGAARGIGSADTIMLISLAQCTAEPDILDNFPPPRFTPEEYQLAPMIPNFGWDGYDLFAIATYIRNSGFGKLYIYNSDLKKAQGPLNVVGECCYRDPIFSPDGSHLLFAFQKYPGGDGSIQLYLIPFGSIGTGATYSPINLPPLDSKSLPQPVLRPAK